MTTCSISDCQAAHYSLRYCRVHYRKFKRWGNPLYNPDSITHKLLKLELSKTGCWIWRGARNDKGYGQIWIDSQKVYVHRFIHELFIGPIPPEYEVDHLCSNPSCARPDHLEAVSRSENVRRAWLRGERKSYRREMVGA